MIVTRHDFKGTDEEVRNQIIDHVIRRLYTSHTFGYYTAMDIYQECWKIALIALDSGDYDITRPMEKFLYSHLKNRLRNLYRDKCFRKMRPNESPDAWEKRSKKKASLMSVAEYTDDKPNHNDSLDEVVSRDLQEYIIERLPVNTRNDFRLLIMDEPLKEHSKQYIRSLVEDILSDGY
jgi:DNA-directed RNA polymerase specialized sigma24 family protein